MYFGLDLDGFQIVFDNIYTLFIILRANQLSKK